MDTRSATVDVDMAQTVRRQRATKWVATDVSEGGETACASSSSAEGERSELLPRSWNVARATDREPSSADRLVAVVKPFSSAARGKRQGGEQNGRGRKRKRRNKGQGGVSKQGG